MAYVKTVWETGDVITAEKLNNMEGGIEAHDAIIFNGVAAAQETGYTITFDISAEEMFAAFAAGKMIVLHYPENSAVGLNEGFGTINYINREPDGSGGYSYGAADTYGLYLYATASFSDDHSQYIVSSGSE